MQDSPPQGCFWLQRAKCVPIEEAFSRKRVAVEVRLTRLWSLYLDEPDPKEAVTLQRYKTEHRRPIPRFLFRSRGQQSRVFPCFLHVDTASRAPVRPTVEEGEWYNSPMSMPPDRTSMEDETEVCDKYLHEVAIVKRARGFVATSSRTLESKTCAGSDTISR